MFGLRQWAEKKSIITLYFYALPFNSLDSNSVGVDGAKAIGAALGKNSILKELK